VLDGRGIKQSPFADFVDPCKYVYHFTSANTAAAILSTRTVRCSRFCDLNDPKESKNWSINYSARDASIDLATRYDIEINRHFRENVRVSCFTADSANGAEIPPHLRSTSEIFRSRSRRGFAHPRMWAMYADNWRGVCFVFDRNLLRDSAMRFAESRSASFLSDIVSYVEILPASRPTDGGA